MKKYVLLVIAAATLSACGDKNKKQQPEVKTVETEAKAEPVVHEPAALQAEFKTPLIADVYKNYIAIKSGLVNSDAAKTQEAAKALLVVTQKMEGHDAFKTTATKLAKTSDLKKQRAVFQSLTDEMKTLAESDLSSGKLYYQFCPMAFGGKGGSWLSNVKEIMNPYYGDAMLHCGEVRETLE